jgi:PIN domain nuclease of toxin-antitoxin system
VKLLLDTHALLWSLVEPHKLSVKARSMIQHPDNALLVSSASAWELGIKQQLGRLEGAEAVLDDFLGNLERLHAEVLAISARHALSAAALPPYHRDPFDRMLVAQARLEGAVLVTNDGVLDRYDVSLLW